MSVIFDRRGHSTANCNTTKTSQKSHWLLVSGPVDSERGPSRSDDAGYNGTEYVAQIQETGNCAR